MFIPGNNCFATNTVAAFLPALPIKNYKSFRNKPKLLLL